MESTFAEAICREQRLLTELADCPIVDVTGVVSASGAGASHVRGQELWTLQVSFDAWRVGSAPLRSEPLALRRKMAGEDVRSWQDALGAETVVRVRARIAEENVLGSPQGILEEVVGPDSCDAKMQAALAELQRPVVHRDPVLGELALDRSAGWYSASVLWNGGATELCLAAPEPDSLRSALAAAHALWRDQAAWNERVRDYAVQELLPVKNDHWLEEGETALPPNAFKTRMVLESVIMHPDGSFEFWHHDGGLFWGHAIQVYGSLSEGPTHADIVG